MISAPLARVVRRFLLGQRMLCLGYTAAIPVYGVVACVVLSGQVGASEGTDRLLVLALAALGAAVTMAAVSYRRWSLSDAHITAVLARPVDGERLARSRRSGGTDQLWLQEFAMLPGHERKFVALVANLQTALVINLAVNEVVALIGLVLTLLESEVALFVPFAAASLALNVWMWPDAECLYMRLQRIP